MLAMASQDTGLVVPQRY